jgi:hypothetical protein
MSAELTSGRYADDGDLAYGGPTGDPVPVLTGFDGRRQAIVKLLDYRG